jgi:hypothetical protein
MKQEQRRGAFLAALNDEGVAFACRYVVLTIGRWPLGKKVSIALFDQDL